MMEQEAQTFTASLSENLEMLKKMFGNTMDYLPRTFQIGETPAALITIASACGGAGGIILCPLLSQVISHWGWRTGYHFMAALVLLIMLPIALFLFDFSPYARGVKPLANKSRKAAGVTESALARSGGRIPPVIYVLTALFFLIAALSGGMYIHISSAL